MTCWERRNGSIQTVSSPYSSLSVTLCIRPSNASVTYTPADLTSAEKYEIRCAESWLPLMIKTRLPIAASSETKRSNSATASACGVARW